MITYLLGLQVMNKYLHPTNHSVEIRSLIKVLECKWIVI